MATRRASEAEKRRQVPGIEFVDGPAGRRAHIEGSLDVWEVISAYQGAGCSRETVLDTYEQMTAEQLDAALRYYALYPSEIDDWLERQAWYTPERTAAVLRGDLKPR